MAEVHKGSEWQNQVNELIHKLQILLAELSHYSASAVSSNYKIPYIMPMLSLNTHSQLKLVKCLKNLISPSTKGYICNRIHFLVNNLNYNVFPIVLL